MFQNGLRESLMPVWQKVTTRFSHKQIAFGSLLVATFILFFVIIAYLVAFPAGNGKRTTTIDVPTGSSVRKLATELKSKKVIRNAALFVWQARLKGVDNRIQAGTYLFNDGMTAANILEKLAAGDVYVLPFAVPEGYSIHQIAIMLEQRGFCRSDTFLSKCMSQELLRTLGLGGKSVEGYLYPGTYNLVGKQNEESLIRAMVTQFNTNHRTRFEKQVQASGMTWNHVLTLASMVEKEAVVPTEKPLIASVFHNRLKKGMRLQSDPTAVYGKRAFAGKVTRSDIIVPSAYNTYLINSLPPGPIGNPGTEAIEAVLNPARTSYYYFVARNDGSHYFSNTLEEHNRAVRAFLKNPQGRRQAKDTPRG